MSEVLITSGEAARQLGVSTSLLRKLEGIGVTPPARRLSRFRIHSPAEVEALGRIIAERRAEVTQAAPEAA